jgi:hypothetical protein
MEAAKRSKGRMAFQRSNTRVDESNRDKYPATLREVFLCDHS